MPTEGPDRRGSLIAFLPNVLRELWLVKIFAQEFGHSDVVSNYSRTYAWMANQLGHMTLGLGTAMLYVWTADTIGAIARLPGSFFFVFLIGALLPLLLLIILWWHAPNIVQNARSRHKRERDLRKAGTGALQPTSAAELRRKNDFPPFIWLSFGLLIAILLWFKWARVASMGVSSAILLVAVIAILLFALRHKSTENTATIASNFLPCAVLPVHRAQGALIVMLFLAIGVMTLGVPVPGFMRPSPMYGDLSVTPEVASSLATPFASAMMFGAVLLLAKDWRYMLLAALGIAMATLIPLQGLYALTFPYRTELAPLDYVALSLSLLIIVYTSRFFRLGNSYTASGFLGSIRSFGALMGFSLLFLYFFPPISPEGQTAVAGAICSVAVWWVKEYGSDLPAVLCELQKAQQDRKAAFNGDPVAGRTPEALHREYLLDAAWDLRADSVFYLAGAIIGAGAVVPSLYTPEYGHAVMNSGIEVLGTLLFIALFLILGRNWGYRQFQMDRTGAPRAHRLAIFWGRMRLIRGDGQVSQDPLTELRTFARGIGFNGETSEFDHLAVFGGQGTGKGPLANALVTEAALADAPARTAKLWEFFNAPGQESSGGADGEGGGLRSARLISARSMIDGALRDRAARPIRKREIDRTPPHDLYSDHRVGAPGSSPNDPVWRRSDRACGELAFRAADLVVIGDYLPDGADTARIVENLEPGRGQKTVWVFGDAVLGERMAEKKGGGYRARGFAYPHLGPLAAGLGCAPERIAVLILDAAEDAWSDGDDTDPATAQGARQAID